MMPLLYVEERREIRRIHRYILDEYVGSLHVLKIKKLCYTLDKK